MEHNHTRVKHQSGNTRLLFVLLLNVGISVAQLIGGVIAGSLALIADALHNATDAGSIGISFIANRISGKDADARRTFGYQRAEVIGALVNLVTLLLISLYLIGHAIDRFFSTQSVSGEIMMGVGLIAFVEDLLSVWLLRKDADKSHNVQSAYLHMLGDTLSTVAVMLGGLAVWWAGWYWIDPLFTILIALFLFYHGQREIRSVIRILMNSAPPGINALEVAASAEEVAGVEGIHHVHVWMLDEHTIAMEAHVVVSEGDLPKVETIKRSIKEHLEKKHGIRHSTLEMEIEPGCEGERTVIANVH